MEDLSSGLGDRCRYPPPKMKISLQSTFFVMTLIALGIVFALQQSKLASLSNQLGITQRNITVNVTRETSSFRWSFKQQRILDCEQWMRDKSNSPYSIPDVRRTADELVATLDDNSEIENLAGWQYGSILTTQIEPGYGQTKPVWVYIVDFAASTYGVKFGNWQDPRVSLMIFMDGSCYVSDDSWNAETVRALIRNGNRGG